MKTNERLSEEILNRLKEFVVSEGKENINVDTILELSRVMTRTRINVVS